MRDAIGKIPIDLNFGNLCQIGKGNRIAFGYPQHRPNALRNQWFLKDDDRIRG